MNQEQAPLEQPDYAIGYGKPPKHSQFQKNNKQGKGRKKGAKGLKTIVNEAMGQKRTASLGGKTQKLTKIELTIHQVATKASNGDDKASDKAIALYERYGPTEEDTGPPVEKLERDIEALRHYLAMHDRLNQSSPGQEQADD